MSRFLNDCFFVTVAAFAARKNRQMFRTGKSFSVAALLFGAVMLSMSTQATAAAIVDQSQLSANQGIPWPGDVPNGQSFTAGLSGLLTQIDVFSNGPNTGGTATLNMYSGDGLGGPALGSVIHAFGSTPGTSPISFDVSSLGISVSSGSVYTFAITQFTGSQQITSNGNNPYAGGRQYDNPSFYGNNPGWDLTFRTFVDTAVPEPASAILLMTGLAGLAVRRKRA